MTNLDGLVKLLADGSNLYAQQSSREFHTNEKEMSAFLEINYIKSIDKPTIRGYWECECCGGVTGALGMLRRDRDLGAFYGVSIFRAAWGLVGVTGVAGSDPLSAILARVLVILFRVMVLVPLASVWWGSRMIWAN